MFFMQLFFFMSKCVPCFSLQNILPGSFFNVTTQNWNYAPPQSAAAIPNLVQIK
jgi:hypothetical protein